MTMGLVLGAGGTAGEAFHRGVVRAMTDLGLDARQAEVVVGTSAGSIVAASLRRHATPRAEAVPAPPAQGVGARLHRLVPRRSTALGLWRRPRQALNAALLSPEFAIGRTSLEFMRSGLAARHQVWPQAPLFVVAVRRSDGRRVVFGAPGEPRPDVGAAVAASCAIPGYFTPITIDGVDYVDGGLHSPTNADVLAGAGLDLVVVSSPMSMQVRSARPRLDLPLRLLFHGYLQEEVLVLRRRRTRVVTIAPDTAVLTVMGLNMMDGRGIHDIEERAYELARRRLRDVPLELAARPRA
jgi:NTE family protein